MYIYLFISKHFLKVNYTHHVYIEYFSSLGIYKETD